MILAEKSSGWMANCFLVWLITTLLFFDGNTRCDEFFRHNSGEPGFAYAESQTVCQGFEPYGMSTHEANMARLRANSHIHIRILTTVPKQRKVIIRVQFSNPAFGGRGCGIMTKLRAVRKQTTTKTLTEIQLYVRLPRRRVEKFTISTWNTRSLTYERYNYCKSLNYDVLAITELWRNQGKYQNNSNEFLVSEPKIIKSGPRKGEKRFPNDPAAGVGILLSPRMQQKVYSFGSEGERVCWVRLSGPACDLHIIAVYLPHRGRVEPCQEQTLADVQKVLNGIPARDCICLLGDFNEQIEANLEGITGNWTGGPPSANAKDITDILRLHNLTAINTLFKPKENSYLCAHTSKQRGKMQMQLQIRGSTWAKA